MDTNKYTEFCFISTQVLRMFTSPSDKAIRYLFEEFIRNKAKKSNFSFQLKTFKIPKQYCTYITSLYDTHKNDIIAYIKEIRKASSNEDCDKLEENDVERELLNAISNKKYYYLPATLEITGHTDFSGNIYISNEFKRVIENEIEIEKNDKSFLCLATLCHEIMGHFFKLLFGNKKYMNTPRYCMLYNDKKQELYPEAGCFIEIMLFGSVINSVSQIEGKSQLLFEKNYKERKKLLKII